MRRLLATLLIVLAVGATLPLIAQESAEDQKSGFLRFVEDRLSTPERRISISGFEGALSSDVSIAEISISDREGVWLRIENARLNWNQAALLTGRLQVNALSADSIEYLRASLPAEGIAPPSPETQGISIPQFPVAIFIDDLNVPKVTFGEELFGLGAEISIKGRAALDGGSLDTKLDIERQDGPGGALALALKYDSKTENADIDLALTEPPDGVIVNLLDMDDKPELSLRVVGSGALSSLETNLTLDAGGKRALTGLAQLTRTSAGLSVTTDLHGPIADLVPLAYKSFFGPETALRAKAMLRDGGGIDVESLTLDGGEFVLQANAATASDGFLRQLKLDAQIGGSGGRKVLLPGGGADAALSSAHLQLDYGNGEGWQGNLSIGGLETSALKAQSISLDLSGVAVNLDNASSRRITFNADGRISGVSSEDPQIADAFGQTMGIGIAGLWNAGDPLKIAQARMRGKAFDLTLAGNLDQFTFAGDIGVSTPSIAPFSGLAGRQLSGGLDLTARGSIALLTGGFDLDLTGNADNLALGIEMADKVIAGKTVLSGRLARSETGVIADGFQIANDQSKLTANGTFASNAADFAFTIALADLGLLSENASGALSAVGTAKGQDGPINLAFDAIVASGNLAGRKLSNGQLGFKGVLTDGDVAGDIVGAAFLDGHRVDLTGGVATEQGSKRLTGLKFSTAGTALDGDVYQSAGGLLTGKLNMQSSNISIAAALLLAKAEGAVNAAIELAPQEGKQSAKISAQARGLRVNDIQVGSADIDADVEDMFGVPAIDGALNGTQIVAAGLDIETLTANASHKNDATAFELNGALRDGTKLDAAGRLAPVADGYSVALDRMQLAQGSLSAQLVGRTALTVTDGAISLNDLTFDVGGGRITSSGTAGHVLDLGVSVSKLPLAIANTVLPDLGLGGTVSGTLRVTGDPTAPNIGFDVTGNGIDAAMISGYGITPLQMDASGTFVDGTLRLAALQANAPGGASLNASGTLPLVGSNGDLRVTGTVPLSLASRAVSDRGTQLSGNMSIDARVGGSLAKPSFSGNINTANAEIVDPLSNLRLQAISANARLSGEQIVIERFNGALATGGSISATGAISLKANADFPADIDVSLNSARYADGNIFVATASGQLKVSGALLRDPLLSGNLRLEKAEISVPDSLDNGAVLLDVEHKSTPADVADTLRRMRVESTDGRQGTSRPSIMQLDIAVSAPNQIFVRGRGVDAELGGQVRLTGSVNDIQPVGGFELVRGRLSILGQRIVFTSGTVTLVGNLDPYVNLTARTDADSTLVFVTVSGPVSNLLFDFSSEPQLPQDEVLSLLIFKRNLGELSPLQLAKLAAAAAELAGGRNNALVDSLRAATGLADLDVVTDAEGNAAVKAGAYVQDNVYVSVQAGAQGDSKVSIDLDLTDTLKARGSANNEGETSVGLFYEQDY